MGGGFFLALSDGVATIDSDLRARHITCCVAQEVDDRTHQVLGLTHATLRNQGGPVLVEIGVLVEDLLGSVRNISS